MCSHGIGGITGMILTGFLADTRVNPGGFDGACFGNGKLLAHQIVSQVTVIVVVLPYSYVICKLVNFIIPLRVSEEQERLGLDVAVHGESIVIDGIELSDVRSDNKVAALT